MEPSRPTAFDDSEFDDPRFDDPTFSLTHGLTSTREERTAALIAHLSSLVGLGIIAPLVIYLLKKDESPFVADQAREALNFHITVVLALVASALLIVIVVGIFLLIAVAIGATVLSIVAAIKANDGERYRYPFTLRLVS